METQFTQAIDQICEEKNIDKATVMEAVEAALAAAYKKDYGEKDQEVRVELSEDTGAIEVFVEKEVVEEVDNPNLEIAQTAATKLKKGVKVGDTVEVMDLPADFGRIAAQTAKQVIVQRIREAERDMVFSEYKDKEGDIVNCIVQRVEGDTVICDLGKASAVLYRNEQIPGERYYPNQRFRVFIVKVEQTARGPQIVVSRSHPAMVKKLFESEVPEIVAGTVEIKGVAREAGGRTKIAVSSSEEGVDPVGSFVGQRGIRVQSVMNEIGGEKIDIILWDEDPKLYIENALSPAKIAEIKLDEKEQKAQIKVPEDQLSLAIGKQGQNVRLAAKLTGWNIDIEGSDTAGVEKVEEVAKPIKRKNDKKDLEAAIIEAAKKQSESEVEPEKDTEAPKES
ncbi:MAG: transcription termination factor NusA [Patescibacteria group bacterium]|nr:transcription termination factor NusA [Patescibacteria group bacterium]